MYLLGYDVGSSSIKATLLDAESGRAVASASSPKKEMEMIAVKPGWAEQRPEVWWENVKAATAEIKSAFAFDPADVRAIGISYQMHGLVVVDKRQQVLRPSIIWCDSRAVEAGNRAAKGIGRGKCLKTLLNLPGNFTASKLKWVRDNEPKVYKKIHKAMLPGDYIAMRMTERIVTTPSGLSEGIMWDFRRQGLAKLVLDYYGIAEELIPEVLPTFSIQGEMTKKAADELGLKAGTVVSYRAGDQPNNALSLNVLNPGEIAATAGTSGVVYGVIDKPSYDVRRIRQAHHPEFIEGRIRQAHHPEFIEGRIRQAHRPEFIEGSRVNTFVHVNYTDKAPRYGVLLCINGTGSLNRWLRHNVADTLTYDRMNELASQVHAGCDGLTILPYGNGAERTLENNDIGARIYGLSFNTHTKAHLLRAGQESIVFALNYGIEIMHKMGVKVKTVRAGNANMFLSPLFGRIFAAVTKSVVELYNTDGSQGAARGAGIGAKIYKDYKDAFVGLDRKGVIEPDRKLTSVYAGIYENWKNVLRYELKRK